MEERLKEVTEKRRSSEAKISPLVKFIHMEVNGLWGVGSGSQLPLTELNIWKNQFFILTRNLST